MDSDQRIFANKYRFFMVSALAGFIATLDASIVNVSLPTLSRVFSADVDLVAWVILAYSLTITALLLLVGRIAARKGYRLVYMVGFAFFTLGSAACAVSFSITQLIASRILQGIGAAFMMSAGPALVARGFPPSERGKSLGLFGTVIGAGLMTGPPLGGFLISTVGWRWIFIINLPIGVFGFFYAAKYLKLIDPDHPESRIDYFGGACQAVGLILLLLFFNRLSQPGWSSAMLYGVLAVALAALALFFWRETHTDSPLIGLSIFANIRFTIALATMTVLFISSSAGLVMIPFYLEEVLHQAPAQVGLILMTIPVCMFLIAPWAGRLSDAIGDRIPTTVGLVVYTIGTFLIATLNENSRPVDLVWRLIIVGAGSAIFASPNSSAMLSSIPKRFMGIASGLQATARNLGITAGVAISTAVFAHRYSTYQLTVDATQSFVQAFRWVINAFAFVAVVALMISLLRIKQPLPKEPEGES
ncbi:MAG: MFS transporter [candidate division Zixibacteria bacterium]|nr:MFS transporter [candidate division Zixibacteria bacterium]